MWAFNRESRYNLYRRNIDLRIFIHLILQPTKSCYKLQKYMNEVFNHALIHKHYFEAVLI